MVRRRVEGTDKTRGVGASMRRYERFVVAPMGGAPGNEYRVTQGHLEFRTVNSARGRSSGTWRVLSPEDVLMHVNLKTPVGKWLVARSITGSM